MLHVLVKVVIRRRQRKEDRARVNGALYEGRQRKMQKNMIERSSRPVLMHRSLKSY